MARYIDADALKERLEDFSKWCRDGRKQGVDFVLDCPLPNMPAADVAPRVEVARKIFEEIRDLIRFTMEPNSTTLYAKIEFEKLEALKKKYTQPEPTEGD